MGCLYPSKFAANMFVVLVTVLFLQIENGVVSEAAPTSQAGSCSPEMVMEKLRVICKGTPNAEQLRRDLKAMNLTGPMKLTITHVRMTTLPGFLFENITVTYLRILSCNLQSLHEDSLTGVGSLELLDLSRNNLTAIPRALGALTSLRMLYMAYNRITTLGVELAPLSSSLGKIILSGNNISSIHEDALKDMSYLVRFGAKDNSIKNMPLKLFRTAPRLQQIDLRSNLIENVDNLFDGLLELHTLKLEDNRIQRISTLSASRLPSLLSVSLDFNPIDALTLFGTENSAIENLSLQNCNISDVSRIPFACIQRLRHLKISNNRIEHIDKYSFPNSINSMNYTSSSHNDSKCVSDGSARLLLVIDISNNHIDAMNDAFEGIEHLQHLNIADNELQNIPDYAFKTNINLKQLHMSSNKISWIGKHAFQGLVSLRELYLSSNRLTSLNGSLHDMPGLDTLLLNQNQLLTLGEWEFTRLPALRRLQLEMNNISDVRGAFRNLGALRRLYLHGNNLKTVHRASFPETTRLKVITIEDNPLMCDCQLSWLYEIQTLHSYGHVPLCHSPERLSGSPFLRNETKESLDIWLEDCDVNCDCTCTVSEYRRSIKADCSHRSLKATPRKFPEDASVVDLSGNLLDTLDASLAKQAPMVQNLSLADNFYTNVDWKILPTNLTNLFLQNNALKDFPIDLVSNLNLSGIWLSGNPWDCDCEVYSFRQWAESHEDTIKDADDVTCAAGPNARLSSMLFMDLQQNDLCPLKASPFVTYGVPFLVVLAVCLTITMIYVKREREIKIWLYAHGVRWVKEDDLDKDKAFDVFLSFSSKDSDWAYSQLLPGLEESGFSVCTYDRNFKGGFLLQDIIKEAVACSRRTLLLLTQNFVESEWCRWEFRVAYHTVFQEKINRLIVVVVGKVPDNIDEDLALYMKTTNYVCWGEKYFWDKLKYSLPKKDT